MTLYEISEEYRIRPMFTPRSSKRKSCSGRN